MKIDLLSVASVIDDETKMVYARYQDGNYDQQSAKHLLEMSKSWFSLLDKNDEPIVNELLYQIKKIK